MSCASFRLWVVSDDHEDRRRAEKHAEDCTECAQILIGQRALRDQVEAWAERHEAPAELEERIRSRLAEVARPSSVTEVIAADSEQPRGRSRLWLALAASFLVGIGLGLFHLPARGGAPVETRRLLDASALEIARQEEEAQLRAISLLEEQAAPILARASDRKLASQRAAWLMETRSRIATLDGTIEDVQGFVAQNPGHPRARTMLLDAYKEKKDVLREVIAREERWS